MKKMTMIAAKVMTAVLTATLVLGSNVAKALATDEIAGQAVDNAEIAAVSGQAFEIVPAEEIAEAAPTEEIAAPAEEIAEVVEEIEEEPVVEEIVNDFYMVFSIAKAERVDNSNGNKVEGKDLKDYFQIKGVASKEIENRRSPRDNRVIGRYNILINEAQVLGLMANVLGTDKITKVINETNGSKIASYSVDRNQGITGSNAMIETVLSDMGVLDEVTETVRAFVRNTKNTAVQSFLASKYPEIDFNSDNWCIDWYIMKSQSDSIHVDGVFVTITEPEEEIIETNEVPAEEIAEEIAAPAEAAAPAEEIVEEIVEEIAVPAEEIAEEIAAPAEEIAAPAEEIAAPAEEIAAPAEEIAAPAEEIAAPALVMAKEIPFIPFFEEVEEEVEIATGSAIEMDVEDTVEEIEVEKTEIPAGAAEEIVEVLSVETPEVPEGAVEEIEVEVPEVPAGEELPQTGLPSAALFYEFGAAFMGLGSAVLVKALRKKEN